MELDPTTIFAGMTATAALLVGGAKAAAEYRKWQSRPQSRTKSPHKPRQPKPRSRS